MLTRLALLFFSLGAGTSALSGDLTLTLGTVGGTTASPHFQIRDPNGSSRNILLPALPGTNSECTGAWYLIRNAGTANTLVVKNSTGLTTYATLNPGDWVWMLASGATPTWYVASGSVGLSSLTLTGLLTAVGVTNSSTLTQTANIVQTTTQAASGTALSSANSLTSATGSPIGAKIAVSQLTNARTSGNAYGVEIDTAGLAGDTGGGTYVGLYQTHTANGGSAVAYGRRLAAGFTAVDDLSLLNSGTAKTLIRDNVAIGWGIYEGNNPYAYAVTTDSAERFVVARTLKLTDASDATKALEISVANVTAGQTRVLTMADAAVNLADIATNTQSIAKFGSADALVKGTIAVADAGGGATTAALTLALTRPDGTAIATARQVMITCSTTQYLGNISGSATFGTATTGTIIGGGTGWTLIATDATGAFACTVTDAADETLYFSIRDAAGGQSDVTKYAAVVASNSDAATWSA